MLAWKLVWNTKSVRRSIWKWETSASFQRANRRETPTWLYELTNSSTLRPPRCGACSTTHLLTHLHECILLPWLVWCFIYKLGMLTGQQFQVQLSPSFLWKFTEFRAETPPPLLAFGILNCITPPHLRNSSPRNPSSPSEFQDAARGMVWIFSGITQWIRTNLMLGVYLQWTSIPSWSRGE